MKKLIILITVWLAIPLLFIGQSKAGLMLTKNETSIQGPLRNITDLYWNTFEDDYHSNLDCQICHPPKNTGGSIALDTPLWNHFAYKNSSRISPLNAAETTCITVAPEGGSRMCLYCHDGIVSLNVLGELTDLLKHHPISVDYSCSYNAGLGNLRPTSWVYETSYDVANGTYVAKTIATLLDEDGKLQCTSCHRIHDNTNSFLLCMDNRGSKLCLVCHKY